MSCGTPSEDLVIKPLDTGDRFVTRDGSIIVAPVLTGGSIV